MRSGAAESLSNDDYTKILRAFVSAELRKQPELVDALARRDSVEQLFVAVIAQRDRELQAGQANTPSPDIIRELAFDTKERIGISLKMMSSGETHFRPWRDATDGRIPVLPHIAGWIDELPPLSAHRGAVRACLPMS